MSRRFCYIVVLCIVLAAGGCQRPSRPPVPAADFARDAALETRVRALISSEPALQHEPIEVSVEEEGIVLKGRVRRQKQKEKATEVAIRAGGSAPVINELVVEG